MNVTSKKFNLNLFDAGKAFVIGLLSALAGAVQTCIKDGHAIFDSKIVGSYAISGIVAYLAHAFFVPAQVVTNVSDIPAPAASDTPTPAAPAPPTPTDPPVKDNTPPVAQAALPADQVNIAPGVKIDSAVVEDAPPAVVPTPAALPSPVVETIPADAVDPAASIPAPVISIVAEETPAPAAAVVAAPALELTDEEAKIIKAYRASK